MALKYSRFWLYMGAGWLVLLLYLSFTDLALPQVSRTVGDKINHLLAYGCLMGWYGQILHCAKWRLAIGSALFLVGFAIELVQGQLGHRQFDLMDLLANTAGILGAIVLLYLGADKILCWVERRLIRDVVPE